MWERARVGGEGFEGVPCHLAPLSLGKSPLDFSRADCQSRNCQ